jgi:hypothetical protein
MILSPLIQIGKQMVSTSATSACSTLLKFVEISTIIVSPAVPATGGDREPLSILVTSHI